MKTCPICKEHLLKSKGNRANKRLKYMYSEQYKKKIRIHKSCEPAALVTNRLLKEEIKPLWPKDMSKDQTDAFRLALNSQYGKVPYYQNQIMQHFNCRCVSTEIKPSTKPYPTIIGKISKQIIIDDAEVEYSKEFTELLKIKTEQMYLSVMKGENKWPEPQA